MNEHGFRVAVIVAQSFTELSPGAQRVVHLLSTLPAALADRSVRDEVRGFLAGCSEASVDPVGVERARAVLAAFEGVIGGDDSESVRRVA